MPLSCKGASVLIDKDGNAKTLSLKKVDEDFFLDE
jgi:hypothetical protein